MSFKFLVFLFLILASTNAFDFIRAALNKINPDADPCDNFYRHACPAGQYKHLISSVFDPILEQLVFKQKSSVWENLELTRVLEGIYDGELDANMNDYILNTFEDICENNAPEKASFLLRLQQLLTNSLEETCNRNFCLAPLASVENCTYTSEILQSKLKLRLLTPPAAMIERLRETVDDYISNIRAVNVILDGNYQSGVEKVNNMTQEMIHVLTGWMETTPWAKNYGIKETIEQIANELHLNDDFGIQLTDNVNALMEMETTYLKCSRDISEKHYLFCLIFVNAFSGHEPTPSDFFTKFNAMYWHPSTILSDPLYAIAKDAEEFAGALGLVGLIAGHEISHAVIENPKGLQLFPVFSTEAIDCIQDQYNRTCTEFVEKYCDVHDYQIDENGADMLGLQLAYQLFENSYGDNKGEEYIKVNGISVTYQQLFFYASAFAQCDGQPGFSSGNSHSANNIRSNVVANHPAFKEAFLCASDSRMMSTVEKQCVVYGDKAPSARKKFQRKIRSKITH